MKILVIDPDMRAIIMREVEVLTLDLMQEIVGGYIEFVYHETDWLQDDFIVNEEGLINGLTRWGLGTHIYCGPDGWCHMPLVIDCAEREKKG